MSFSGLRAAILSLLVLHNWYTDTHHQHIDLWNITLLLKILIFELPHHCWTFLWKGTWERLHLALTRESRFELKQYFKKKRFAWIFVMDVKGTIFFASWLGKIKDDWKLGARFNVSPNIAWTLHLCECLSVQDMEDCSSTQTQLQLLSKYFYRSKYKHKNRHSISGCVCSRRGGTRDRSSLSDSHWSSRGFTRPRWS